MTASARAWTALGALGGDRRRSPRRGGRSRCGRSAPSRRSGSCARARSASARRPTGLPDAGGWLLLIGQPIGMIGVLVAVWGAELRRGFALAMARADRPDRRRHRGGRARRRRS